MRGRTGDAGSEGYGSEVWIGDVDRGMDQRCGQRVWIGSVGWGCEPERRVEGVDPEMRAGISGATTGPVCSRTVGWCSVLALELTLEDMSPVRSGLCRMVRPDDSRLDEPQDDRTPKRRDQAGKSDRIGHEPGGQ